MSAREASSTAVSRARSFASVEELSSMGLDPLTGAERNALASLKCDFCNAILLTIEVGPHFRIKHPDFAPGVTKREVR